MTHTNHRVLRFSTLALGTTLAAAASLGLGGCRSGGARVAGETPPALKASFDQLKSLEGEWTMQDEKGQTITASVFKVTAAGSALREVMFPGTPHEMTNLYHLDGSTLVATHYCAEGNQPRMRCSATTKVGATSGPNAMPGGTAYPFTFADVTNLSAADGHYMGNLTVVVVDKDHIRQEWQSMKAGKPSEKVVFALTRKVG